MVDTWKDWTGARSIYFHLPDELGLSRISFYHRETPEDLQLFMYIVMVECRCTGTPEKVSGHGQYIYIGHGQYEYIYIAHAWVEISYNYLIHVFFF
jgi:hypothetical protein